MPKTDTKKHSPKSKRVRTKTIKRVSHHHHTYLHHDGIATVEGTHHWFKHLFEHLGWMILAKERGYHDKLFAYKNSIHRIIESIDERLPKLEDKDTKKDFEIMKEDLLILKKHVEEDKL